MPSGAIDRRSTGFNTAVKSCRPETPRRSESLNSHDPFRHHPELRGKVKPAAESFFRDLDMSAIDAHAAKSGFPSDWRTPCEVRDADWRQWLDEHGSRDLWVFAYGSLMWDPALEFDEVRQAYCTGYQRSFCMWDDGGRGSKETPGLMLAIDEGGSCEGLAFCIPQEKLEHETYVLFRREMLLPVYRPVLLDLDTVAGPIKALAFVANRDHEDIKPGIPFDEQARMIAHASGFLGDNFDYLSNVYEGLEVLGVEDPYVSELYAATVALRETSARA